MHHLLLEFRTAAQRKGPVCQHTDGIIHVRSHYDTWSINTDLTSRTLKTKCKQRYGRLRIIKIVSQLHINEHNSVMDSERARERYLREGYSLGTGLHLTHIFIFPQERSS